MPKLSISILAAAKRQPEGEPLRAKALLHLGSRAAVDQTLSRLVRRGALLRVGRGLYVRPVASKFGVRPPASEKVVHALARQTGETIVSHPAVAANRLGLTTQNPVREVYLTSGRSRRLTFGGRIVELRHAVAWRLVLPERPAGEAVRALSWAGERRARTAINTIRRTLPERELQALVGARANLPTWMATAVSALV